MIYTTRDIFYLIEYKGIQGYSNLVVFVGSPSVYSRTSALITFNINDMIYFNCK